MGFRKPVTVWRMSAGTVDDNGHYTAGQKTKMTIQASVQPMGNQERYTIVSDEGARNVMYIKLYSNTPLQTRTNTDDAGTDADIVEWQGKQFRVIQTDYFQSGVISHYRAYAVEVRADDE